MVEEYNLKIKRLVVEAALDHHIVVNPERIQVQATESAIKTLFYFATQEDLEAEFPADWWQAFKARWFPDILKRRFPVIKTRIIAVHKFPELNLPDSVLGREFVHLKLLDV